MRFFYVIMFLATIVFSDVISSALAHGEHEVTLIDHTSESESENETELEVELKKEAKVRHQFGFSLFALIHYDLYHTPNFLDRILLTPYKEIHSPPPE